MTSLKLWPEAPSSGPEGKRPATPDSAFCEPDWSDPVRRGGSRALDEPNADFSESGSQTSWQSADAVTQVPGTRKHLGDSDGDSGIVSVCRPSNRAGSRSSPHPASSQDLAIGNSRLLVQPVARNNFKGTLKFCCQHKHSSVHTGPVKADPSLLPTAQQRINAVPLTLAPPGGGGGGGISGACPQQLVRFDDSLHLSEQNIRRSCRKLFAELYAQKDMARNASTLPRPHPTATDFVKASGGSFPSDSFRPCAATVHEPPVRRNLSCDNLPSSHFKVQLRPKRPSRMSHSPSEPEEMVRAYARPASVIPDFSDVMTIPSDCEHKTSRIGFGMYSDAAQKDFCDAENKSPRLSLPSDPPGQSTSGSSHLGWVRNDFKNEWETGRKYAVENKTDCSSQAELGMGFNNDLMHYSRRAPQNANAGEITSSSTNKIRRNNQTHKHVRPASVNSDPRTVYGTSSNTGSADNDIIRTVSSNNTRSLSGHTNHYARPGSVHINAGEASSASMFQSNPQRNGSDHIHVQHCPLADSVISGSNDSPLQEVKNPYTTTNSGQSLHVLPLNKPYSAREHERVAESNDAQYAGIPRHSRQAVVIITPTFTKPSLPTKEMTSIRNPCHPRASKSSISPSNAGDTSSALRPSVPSSAGGVEVEYAVVDKARKARLRALMVGKGAAHVTSQPCLMTSQVEGSAQPEIQTKKPMHKSDFALYHGPDWTSSETSSTGSSKKSMMDRARGLGRSARSALRRAFSTERIYRPQRQECNEAGGSRKRSNSLVKGIKNRMSSRVVKKKNTQQNIQTIRKESGGSPMWEGGDGSESHLQNDHTWSQLLQLNVDGSQVIELNRAQGKPFGFFVARGRVKESKGVFVSRMQDQSTQNLLAGLLDVGDEILEVEGVDVRDADIIEVNTLMAKKRPLLLTVLPYICRKDI